MTSIIKLQAVSGAMDESPPCYILQVDEVKILLDCGWDEKFDPDFMKELKRHIHTIDAVLLSYPDAQHLGALPYIVGKLGLNCPIYATIPVYKMGQMFMYDLYQSHYNNSEFDIFTLDDVDAAFDKIVQLKYNQSVAMKGKGYGITLTPLPAGHMIGGTIWKIVKVGEEDIVYAMDFNHKKERHLNGCELKKFQRPSLFIADAYNATYKQAGRRARDEKLMTNILQTLRNNGNVLVAVDTAGRVLELAHMLDQLWKNKESGLLAYSLALLNNVSYNVVEFAKSQIEWMSENLMRSFEGARNNPFHFRHVVLCHSLAELSRVSGPKVVLASSPDMESGFARELFIMWANNPNNSIILTARASPGTLGRDLQDNGGDRIIELLVQKRVKLDGPELDEYLRNQREKRGHMVFKREEEAMSSESEDELEMCIITGKHDIVVKQEDKPQTGFFKSNRRQHAMFPFLEEKIKWDEYGEIIKPEDYKFTEITDDVEEIKENIVVKQVAKEVEEVVDTTEPPTKCISALKKIDVKAQIQYIDFEGHSDGESLFKILSQLKPRRVIVVRGSPEGTDAIRIHCGQMGARVFCPKRGEIVDATTETHIYQVRLTDALISQLSFQKGKEAEVAWMDAEIALRDSRLDRTLAGEDEDQSEQMEQDDSEQETILTLEPMAPSEIQGHQSVFINELKLADFKQVLNKCNISSEFSGGVLWCCNGTMAIRKIESGHVTVEGCLSEEYYRVRELLYEQYAIV